jgi:hypothetical protein
MAGTYFGYAERKASDEINWAQIGKNLTDMLQNESKIREDKKDAIDKASTEYGNTLANAPQGEHQGINTWALTYADSAQQARLLQDKLLKSGQLKLKDYNIMRQNITDGTTQAFNLIKDYQAEYKDKMERYQKKESSGFEPDLMAEAEGFANFNESELYINPTNFTVNIAKKEKQIVDGKEVYVMSKNPNNFTTVNAMRNRITGKFDRLDVAKTLQEGVSVLGKDKEAILNLGTLTRGGSITEIIDITRRKDFGVEAKEAVSLYQRAEDTYLDSILSNPDSAMSVLYDYVAIDPENKKNYKYTWDSKEAGGNLILVKNSPSGRPVPQLDDKQREVAKNALREKFRIMLDKEVDIKATPQAQLQERRAPTEGQMDRADRARIQQAAAGAWNQLYTGKTAAEKRAAADILLGTPMAQQQGLLSIDLTDAGKVKLIYNNPKMDRTIDMGNASFEDFSASGVELHGEADRARAIKAGGGGKAGYGNVADWSGIISSRAGTSAITDYDSVVRQYADDNVSTSIVEDSPQKTAGNLNNKFGQLGLTFKGYTKSGIYDKIDIMNAAGTVLGTFSVDDLDDVSSISNIISNSYDKDKATKAFANQGAKSAPTKTTVTGGTTR